MGRPSQAALFAALRDRYDAKIAQAFIDAMAELRDGADLARVIQAISDGNIEEAMAALHLDPAALQPIVDAVRQSYQAGGNLAVAGMPTLQSATGARFVIRFAIGNPRAQAWLAFHSSRLVTNLLEDQRAGLREALSAGMAAGNNPRTTALEIVGRINRATGAREGGMIGLSRPQMEYLATARQELASRDPALLKNYLTRTIRDKRFDRSVLKAIREGGQVPPEIAQKAAVSYSNRLLKLRGDTIARTESQTSLHTAQDEAFQQAIDQGAVSADKVRDTWHSAGDTRVRDTHQILNGESIKHGQFFVSPSGARMRYPGDISLGAGPEEIVNCRCWLNKRIDFLANLL